MKKVFKLCLTVLLIGIFAAGFLFNPETAAVAAETEEPLMRIAMFADLHVEYDLQSMAKPIRNSIAKAIRYAKELTEGEGVDVVLVGGDMTGSRGSWKQEYIANTTSSIFEYMSSLTKDGKVLLVTGNHDPEPSAKVDTPANGVYSGDYAGYMTGSCGEFVSDLYTSDINSSLSPYDELLCYRYTFNGIEFIGLNTPFVENQAKVCGLYAEQTEWLAEELEEIGKDKTVFLFCHYPYTSVSTIADPSTPATSNPCGADLKRLLNEYSNVVYCYGHVHSGDKWWAKKFTSDIVKPQGNSSLVDRGVYKSTNFINAHMGSMGYYDNVYQPGGLTKNDPLVVQFVMVDIYANRIEFKAHNTGVKYAPNGTEDISPLIIARDMATQMGLDPALGVYNKGDAYGGSSDSASTSTSATPGTDEVTDLPDTGAPSTDGAAAPDGDGEASSNILPIVLLSVLGVVLIGVVVFAVLYLNKGKKK